MNLAGLKKVDLNTMIPVKRKINVFLIS